MTTNELRIGNYVMNEPTIDDWEVIIVKPGTIIQCEISPDSYVPIQLTEEWLLKFGYIKFELNQIYDEWFLNFDGVLKYKILQSSFNLKEVKEFVMPNSDKPINIKYVHQLQNLYFALTGEELTLKIGIK